MNRIQQEMAAIPQRTTEGYDGPLTLGAKVVLSDSSGVQRPAKVWQEPGPVHGLAVFRMDEPNSGGFCEVRPWHGEVRVVEEEVGAPGA